MKTSPLPPVQAHFFGTASGCTSAGREHSGILLQAEDSSLQLDCGAAAERPLVAAGLAPGVPGAIWLSHMHSDHIGQAAMLVQSLWLRKRRAPLRLYGPVAVLEALRDWLPRCLLFPELIGFPLEWQPVEPGQAVIYGPFTLTAFATNHLQSLAEKFQATYPGTSFECYGVSIDFHGRRYVYSADLAHPRELSPALKGVPVTALICELSHYPEKVLFHELKPYSIDTLWITHYGDEWIGREKELQAAAREEGFIGEVRLLEDRVAIAI